MKSFLASPLLVCSVFAVAAIAAAPAHAMDPQPQKTEAFEFDFSYAPGDLDSEKKANRLLGRLEQKVRKQCGADQARMSGWQREQARECVDRTMASSVGKFGSSTLTQLYKSRAAG